MTFTTIDKSTAPTFTNPDKSVSPFTMYLRHGKNPSMADLADYTFESVVFTDGTILKNLTFAQLTDITWVNVLKN